ncbi:hypothetical protein IRJ41_023594, partial [Triplophysa rosa]
QPPKRKASTKSSKGKTPTVVDGVSTEEMSKEQLEEHIVRLREELDREREERNYFQLERDKIHTFWEITKRHLEEKKCELRNRDREMEEAEERHQVEIKVYKQKVKHLLYEQQNSLSELKAEGVVSTKLLQKEHADLETQLHKDLHSLKVELKEQELSSENVLKSLQLKHDEETTDLRNDFARQVRGEELAEVTSQYGTDIEEREIYTLPTEPENYSDTTDQDSDKNLEGQPEAMIVKEGEPNVWRQCPKVKRTFSVSLRNKMWNMIKPLKGSSKLRQPWTLLLYDIFKKENPCCPLAFQYQHVKTDQSRKRNLPYLHALAACTFPSCTAKYTFQMKEKPASQDEDITFSVHQTGDILHKLEEKKSRPTAYLKRGKIAKALDHGPSQCFYTRLQSTPNEQILAGNMTDCPNKNVLKVIGSEVRRNEYLHIDILMEIYLMQTILGEYHIPGYIQLFSMKPFIVHLYTELGINILVQHLLSRSPVSLYLDATGGVV